MEYRDHLYDELREFQGRLNYGLPVYDQVLGICSNIAEQIYGREAYDCGLADYISGVRSALCDVFEELGYDRHYPFGQNEFEDNRNLWVGECRERRVRLLEEMLEHLS